MEQVNAGSPKLTETQLRLLQMIFDHFREHSEWPNMRAVQVRFIEAGEIEDAWETAEQIGFPLIRELPNKDNEDSRITLGVEGIALCRGNEEVLGHFFAMLRCCADAYIQNPKAAEITCKQLKADLKLGSRETVCAYLLVQRETHIAKQWRTHVDPMLDSFRLVPDAARFRSIQSLDEFLATAHPRGYTRAVDHLAEQLLVRQTQLMNSMLDVLHPSVRAQCGGLFGDCHYAEAARKAFALVKDRLRELTGNERATDAFGGKVLSVLGSPAEHVAGDFNEGVKYLAMAIDRFRNVLSHTAKGGILDPVSGFEYLVISSRMMHFLDKAVTRSDESRSV